MENRFLFERNMLALSVFHRGLCARISGAQTAVNHYRFLDAQNGDRVPAIVDASGGGARPLHSLVDPRKEGRRLVSTIQDEGFLVFLGFGGAYHIEAALERETTTGILVIDYGLDGFSELLRSKDFVSILEDPRLRVLIDPPPEEIEKNLLEQYLPAFCGGIRVLPLRARTGAETELFAAAGEAVQSAIEKVSADYSVQAWFGTRWFSNIIRNLKAVEAGRESFPPIREAAVCAAGPSLDGQLETLKKKSGALFIIASDTSLSALLSAGLTPGAVVSIDCQHISYLHFMEKLPPRTPLFLGLASPPLLAKRSSRTFFFSGAHPLERYIGETFRPLPQVDSSGGNVTFAAFSLAEALGAVSIELYGADFSYPLGKVYARGTYQFRWFEKRQDRLHPAEAGFSELLYRSRELVKKEPFPPRWYYETKTLKMYRRRLEEKAAMTEARVSSAEGMGAPIKLENRAERKRPAKIFAPGAAKSSAQTFLRAYRDGIAGLNLAGTPKMDNYTAAEKKILGTLLPQAAAIRRRNPQASPPEALEMARAYSLAEIDKTLAAMY